MRSVGNLAGFVSVAIALTALSAATSWAQRPSGPGSSTTAQFWVISGRIAAVDPAQKKLIVQSGLLEAEQHFVISERAAITDGRRSLKLEELKPGAEITVRYVEQSGQQVAQAVIVQPDVTGVREPLTAPGP